MSSEQLYLNVRASVDRAKNSEYKDKESLTSELEDAKISLSSEDSQIITDLIDIIDKFKDNKGLAVELIRMLVVIVESIQGQGRGKFKKEEASKLFNDILLLINVSQRDRKFYISIFDNAVELIFWGRDWVKSGGWTRLKAFFVKTFSCCKCC